MLKLLLVEDDVILARLLSTYLEQNGFSTVIAPEGQDALRKIQKDNYDLILLDLILPIITGEQVLKYLQSERSKIPVIIITSEDSIETELSCYKNGSRQFHRKPLNCKLLLYQIRSLLTDIIIERHSLSHKDLRLDTQQKLCYVQNIQLEISPTEYKFLTYLLKNPNRLISKKELSVHLYSDYSQQKFNNLDTIVYRIRKKISKKTLTCNFEIQTSKGFGYRI